MRLHLACAAFFALALTCYGEDYQCENDDGCVASHTVDNEVVDVDFRKGDMVSTEAGWYVSSDDGWKKVKVKNSYGNWGGSFYIIGSPVPPAPILPGYLPIWL
jgi:hypothetical protein